MKNAAHMRGVFFCSADGRRKLSCCGYLTGGATAQRSLVAPGSS